MHSKLLRKVLLICCAIVAIGAAILFLSYIRNVRETLTGAAKAELKSALLRWNAAGKSQTNLDIESFMQKMPPHLLVSNRIFQIGTAEYVSLFANTKVSTGGTLFINSNGVIIHLDSHGDARFIEDTRNH